MNLELSETQKQLQTMARDFLKGECPLSVVRELQGSAQGYSAEHWHKMAEFGWLSMIFPEEYGGEEASLLDLAVIYEEMGRALLPSPHLSSAILSGLAILDGGSQAQKAEFLPKIGSGQLVFALALTEPEYDWGASSISTSATAEGDHFVLNGTKLFVPYAHAADYILCVAKTRDSGVPEDDISLFIVSAGASQGLKCNRLSGFLGEPLCEVLLDNVGVPTENLLGELNEGWPYLTRAIKTGTVMQCCEMVGGADFVLELTINYAKERTQFGQFIGSFQRIQDRIINMLNELDKARLFAYEAVWRLSEGLHCDIELSAAKTVVSEAYDNVCNESHHVHAGMGFMTDYDLYLYTRKARTTKNYLGSPSFHRKTIANELAKWA